MNEYEFNSRYEEQLHNFVKSGKPTILVLGATGVGKSTIVNLILKKNIAQTGAGEPVTKGIHTYKNDLITIYDTEGYESGNENQNRYHTLIMDFINEKKLTPKEAINIVWYCISAPAARITDVDIQFIKEIKSTNIPIAIVLTQVDVSTEEDCAALRDSIFSEISDIDVFESTIDENIELENGIEVIS